MVQSVERETYEFQAHAEETEKLADVTRYIKERHLRVIGQMPATAAHQQTANAIQAILEENAATLYSALGQPYFGRLDYFHRDEGGSGAEAPGCRLPATTGPPKTIYLGISFIPEKDVYSWTAPVARLWYTQSFEDGYTAPRGFIPTRVDLKRYLRIREQRIEELNDIFRRQLPASNQARQDVLTQALSGTGAGDGHLQVIVETIEPDQYENIANISDKVLIVQGAAGSGKSEIGLHRIAYLLSPHNDITPSERPTPATTLFVGPSQAFLEYASDILPALGVREHVRQVKFSDWLMSQMSEKPRTQNRIWRNLLAPGNAQSFNEKAEAFKGSLAMADVMEAHVRELARNIRKRCGNLPPLSDPNNKVTIGLNQIRAAVDGSILSAGDAHQLNRRRRDFIDRITTLVWVEGHYGRQRHGVDAAQRRDYMQSRLVSPWCDAAWEQIDFRKEYVSLLSDSENMVRLAKGELAVEDAEVMAESASRMLSTGFDDSDIGALAYLDHLLNGTIQSSYRHIVIDEAQDISPIEFKLLAASSSNNWFTVLGDTAQRLTPYRGIKAWREIERVFGRSEIARQRARRSYRSSKQITQFNNRILRTFDENIPAPIPFERSGHRVEYNRHRTTAEMYQGVVNDIERIRTLDELEDAVVAILARDQANLNRFQRFCESHRISEINLVGQDHHSDAKTVLARIPDVKGLEYDAVIVMGVNDSFSDTLFNKKLLYLATTRAKHFLSIHWSGQQSSILKSISSRGISWYRR